MSPPGRKQYGINWQFSFFYLTFFILKKIPRICYNSFVKLGISLTYRFFKKKRIDSLKKSDQMCNVLPHYVGLKLENFSHDYNKSKITLV